MNEFVEKLWVWFSFIATLAFAAFKLTVDAVAFAFILSVSLLFLNMVTGMIASKREGKPITTKKMRKTINKMYVYLLVISFFVLIGVGLHGIDQSIDFGSDDNLTIKGTLYFVKLSAMIISWIEGTSIIENLKRTFPDVLFLSIVYSIVKLSFVKKIPYLEDALKNVSEKNCDIIEKHDNLLNKEDNEVYGSE